MPLYRDERTAYQKMMDNMVHNENGSNISDDTPEVFPDCGYIDNPRIPVKIKKFVLDEYYNDVYVVGYAYVRPRPALVPELAGCEATFVSEPDNEVDPNAVAVYICGLKYGYVARGKYQDMINRVLANSKEEKIQASVKGLDIENHSICLLIGIYHK